MTSLPLPCYLTSFKGLFVSLEQSRTSSPHHTTVSPLAPLSSPSPIHPWRLAVAWVDFQLLRYVQMHSGRAVDSRALRRGGQHEDEIVSMVRRSMPSPSYPIPAQPTSVWLLIDRPINDNDNHCPYSLEGAIVQHCTTVGVKRGFWCVVLWREMMGALHHGRNSGVILEAFWGHLSFSFTGHPHEMKGIEDVVKYQSVVSVSEGWQLWWKRSTHVNHLMFNSAQYSI